MKKQFIIALCAILTAGILFQMQNKAMYGLILMLVFLLYSLVANRKKQHIVYVWPILPVLAYIIVRHSQWFEYIGSERLWFAVFIYAAWALAGYFIGFFASKWKIIRKNYSLVVFTIIVFALSILSGAVNFLFQFFAVGGIYFIAPFIVYHYISHKEHMAWIIAVPFLLVYSLTAWISESTSVYCYPITVIPFVSIGLYYLTRLIKKRTIVIVIASAYMLFLIYGWCAGMKSYINWIIVQRSDITDSLVEFRFYNHNGQAVEPSDLKDKIVVLDFWNSSCGVCFQTFPEFDKFYAAYRNRDDIAIYSVNLPIIGRDTEEKLTQTINKLTEKYTFPILQADSSDYFKRFKMTGVPHLLVLDKKGEVVYNGNVEFSGNVAYNIHSIVEKALKDAE